LSVLVSLAFQVINDYGFERQSVSNGAFATTLHNDWKRSAGVSLYVANPPFFGLPAAAEGNNFGVLLSVSNARAVREAWP
jgi:hypothetical protein